MRLLFIRYNVAMLTKIVQKIKLYLSHPINIAIASCILVIIGILVFEIGWMK